MKNTSKLLIVVALCFQNHITLTVEPINYLRTHAGVVAPFALRERLDKADALMAKKLSLYFHFLSKQYYSKVDGVDELTPSRIEKIIDLFEEELLDTSDRKRAVDAYSDPYSTYTK